MDCVACGKPISITAKFCGKCGAPVKREEPSPVEEKSTETTAVESTFQLPHENAQQIESTPSQSEENLDELVLTIDLPATSAEHKSILEIDLNLPAQEKPVTYQQSPEAIEPETYLETTSKIQQAPASDWQDQWQADQQVIKSLLEKHSHVLDFISLSAQQQAHVQTQPNPLEPLLKTVIQQQAQLQSQLDAIAHQEQKPSADVTVKMPDEFKLLLEKQKIELQKFFSQNIAANASNIEAANSATIQKIESMLTANAAMTENLEKSLIPMTQTVTELKSKLLAVSKKIDEASTQSKKSSSSNSGDSTEGSGSFIIFIIGLMCGLTVVLSSLAIYNFLSHETTASTPTSHDEPGADHGSAAPNHAAESHDKPAADSHPKDKSH